MKMDLAISVKNLAKNYGKNKVLKNISFDVKKGEIFAILGENSSGKTTLLECIEGLTEYHSGEITVDGMIGVQLQTVSLPQKIKAIQALNLFAKWNKKIITKETLSTFQISDIKNEHYEKMSIGQKRKLHFAIALINDPDIILLDEPTVELDIGSRVALHNQIRKLKSSGKTVIMASNDMSEVDSLCDRIAILKEGRIAFIGTAEEVAHEYGRCSTIYVKTINPLKIEELKHSTFELSDEYYSLFKTENVREALYELLDIIKKSKNTIIDVKVIKSTIEETFMNIARELE
jgi:ABC-2 type transport system ATP-binding protein